MTTRPLSPLTMLLSRHTRRRDFITLLGGAAVLWPLAARAQQRIRRVGVLLGLAADDPESSRRVTVFAQTLQQLGWSEGRDLHVESRWGAGDVGLMQKYAAELVALAPDAILANGDSAMGPLQQATRTIPIVFVNVSDPALALASSRAWRSPAATLLDLPRSNSP